MVATFDFSESNGAGETVTNSISNINFGSSDAPNLVTTTYPVTAGTNSYEKWVRAHFTATFTKIDNIQFWKSAGAFVTGETVLYKANNAGAYAQPTQTTSTVATVTLPTADPGTANVSIGGSLSGNLAAPGYSDYVVMQAQTTVAASPGAVNQKTFTLQYDEI